MTKTLHLLTRPLTIALLWISLAVCVWYIWSSPFSIGYALIPWQAEHVALLLVCTLILLSLLAPLQTKQLHKQIAQQAQNNKLKIQELKRAHKKENDRVQALIQNEQFAYWEWNVKTNEVQYSSQWKRMLGLNEATPIASLHDMQKLIHPQDQKAVQQKLHQIIAGKESLFVCSHRVQHSDGHYIWTHDKGQVYFGNDGMIERIFAIRIDVSEQKWIEDELEVDSIVIEHALEGIAITSEDLIIKRCNRALCQSLQKTRETIEGSDLVELINSLQSQVDSSIIDILKSQGSWRGELSLLDENHNICMASQISIKKIFHETTQTTHYSFIHSDITDLKRTQAALDNLANQDSVTGLANRHKLYNELQQSLHTEAEISLMFLDLDNFKQVNDTLGHDIGDLLLKQVGQTLCDSVPKPSVLARVGGDEFIFYYPQHLVSASELAQRITERLSQPFVIQEHQILVGSSIGIAHYPQHATDRQTLIKAADTAMYQAKRAGKGQFKIYSHE